MKIKTNIIDLETKPKKNHEPRSPKKNSSYEPPRGNDALEAYIENTEKELKNCYLRNHEWI